MSETSDRFLFGNKGYHYKYEGNKGSENHQTWKTKERTGRLGKTTKEDQQRIRQGL